MELYAGFDLHSRNTYIGILDKELTRVFKKRVTNNLEIILATLQPFGDKLKGIVVESTFNWYWLVDGLMEAGYRCVHLANPSAIKQYEGLKHSDDQHEAFFLAQLLILGILPEGYIYPKKDRPVRDLARKRLFLVRHRTSNILSLKSLIERCSAKKLTANEIKQKLTEQDCQRNQTEVNRARSEAVVERRPLGSFRTGEFGQHPVFNRADYSIRKSDKEKSKVG
jgi:hypothetical protein